jgi:hypothetical protein
VGNRTSEALLNDGSTQYFDPYMDWQLGTHGSQLTSQTATYDALGRVTQFAEAGTATAPEASSATKYDAAGNIRRTVTTHVTLDQQGAASSSSITSDVWFRYDAMNRLVTDRGMLSGASGAGGTTIVRGAVGLDIAYDKAGQRTSVARTTYSPGYGDWWGYVPGYYQETREIYNYDGAGRLVETRESQGNPVDEYSYTPGMALDPAPSGPTDGNQRMVFTYDLLGRQLTQTDYSYGTTQAYSRTATYNAIGQLTWETTSTARYDGTWVTSTSNTYTTTAGEYLLGAVAGSSSSTSKNGSYQSSSTTTNSYVWRDGPLQSQIAYAQSGQPTHHTYFTYDAQGALKSASINDGRPRTVTYKTNVEGQAIRRDESDNNYNQGDPHEVWYRFAGRQWGYVGNNGSLSALSTSDSIASRTYAPGTGAFRHGATYGASHTDFALTPEGINSYAQGSAAGSYTVQRTGDTLSGIAQALWGDASGRLRARALLTTVPRTVVRARRTVQARPGQRPCRRHHPGRRPAPDRARRGDPLGPQRQYPAAVQAFLKPAVQFRNSARSMIIVSVKPRYCPGHMNSILRIATEILSLRLHSPPVRACGPSSQS